MENNQALKTLHILAITALLVKMSRLEKMSTIHAHVVIEDDVVINDDTVIYQHSIIHSSTLIGKFCVVHGGCIVGSDGFGFAPKEDGTYKKIPQTGRVVIEDYVDIGANSTIDRATLGETRICSGVKLDNQIQIAHNVEIGANTVIAAQSGVAGSTKIGSNCVIGGQVGIIGHLKVGDNVKIQGQSGVTSNIETDQALYGTPAMSYKDYLKSYIFFKRFFNCKKIRSLENNHMNNFQTTIKKEVTLTGVGLHTGKKRHFKICPSSGK